MTSIVAIDLGTCTGWAHLIGVKDRGIAIHSGTWDCSIRRSVDSPALRFTKFERQLSDLLALSPDKLLYEIVYAHSGTEAGHMYGAFQAKLFEVCDRFGVPCEGVGVQAIKKFATGKGNANKDAVLAAVRLWGHEPQDHNEADAIALARLGWEHM